ncbi:glycosyltransferase family 4 protein [Sphingobium boeckii]|uniref:Glycosyltransferase involved in cell wall biosynthesis n=1 Tax=Sphingobium boeckii TaxID=1082345 RepID=A0A7W9AJ51_9SPHN|nr:glycosyltransferase family 4 protein [Sphingobium boeckii]MBB5686639.1 glycosyltransferase involved in cell wall biosynthesis [Sphingobium boeckii]
MDIEKQSPRVLLVAPNISRKMGGEALKALQILLGLEALGIDVVQVTHSRVRDEVQAMNLTTQVVFVEDHPIEKLFYKLRLNWPLMVVSGWLLHRRALQCARATNPWLVHFTSPISPTLPYFRFPKFPVVIGPLNGNILHPAAFSDRETLAKRAGSLMLWPMQKLGGALFRGKRKATLLVAGGGRTVRALRLGGCSDARMVPSLDSGVDPDLAAAPRIQHVGHKARFVFIGRLVRYKGCDLAIRALRLAPGATIDIYGDGEERAALEDLAGREGVADRVNFLGWFPAGKALFDQLRQYRAFVFPSLAEANGIVVQEAMMLGLPVIALDWGGPALLLDSDKGILIAPDDEAAVVASIAAAMRRLAEDANEANRLSANARAEAERAGYSWPFLLKSWIGTYDRALAECGGKSISQWLAARSEANFEESRSV